MKRLICTAIVLFFIQQGAAYSDSIHWWYSNASGTPGTYMINGPGIDESINAGTFQGNYWIGTNFRHGEIVISRDLQTGINSTYMGGQLVKTYYYAYNPGLEEQVLLGLTSNYSAGNIALQSTSIRYLQDGIWTDWQAIDFTGTLSYTQVPSPPVTISKTYDLATDIAYEAYDVKFNIYVPSGSYNKQYLFYVNLVDNPSISYDPLNTTPQSAIPEPISLVTLGAGIIGLRKWLSSKSVD